MRLAAAAKRAVGEAVGAGDNFRTYEALAAGGGRRRRRQTDRPYSYGPRYGRR